MRPRTANGGIKERRNAARTACDDHTSVTLQGIAAHLDRPAKTLTTAHSLGSSDHVKFAHAFSTDGKHRLEHAVLNRSGRFHLLNFPVGFDFPLAVNHTGGVACLSQRGKGRSKAGGERSGGFTELQGGCAGDASAAQMFRQRRQTGEGLHEVGCVIAARLPFGTLE